MSFAAWCPGCSFPSALALWSCGPWMRCLAEVTPASVARFVQMLHWELMMMIQVCALKKQIKRRETYFG